MGGGACGGGAGGGGAAPPGPAVRAGGPSWTHNINNIMYAIW